MPKAKWNLNAVYISQRLKESLRPISRCALTVIVAPMGYGKTTAVNWYLERRAKAEPLKIIRISIYADNLAMFWQSVQNGFARAGFDFLAEYTCPADAAGCGLLADELYYHLEGKAACYIFIDDFHLLTDSRALDLLCTLAGRLPKNVRIIVASRNNFLPAAEMVRLGAKVYQIGTKQLRLNRAELSAYVRRCGAELPEVQLEKLLYYSEGWFSAVYLNLRLLSERGVLSDRSPDIYAVFTAAMIEPLPEHLQAFLAVMGLADEFTAVMAQFVTEKEDVEHILTRLTEQNAFVKRLSDGTTYRFHHMMKECAERRFLTLEAAVQKRYRERFAIWYEEHRQYLHAIEAYQQSGNYNALLRVIRKDAGVLLASLKPSKVAEMLDQCPAEALKAHPSAILVLMRRMFTWRQVPKMMELKKILLAAIAESPELTAEERGNLLGECDLIMSFLCYNDISAMSRLHRSAGRQMTRPALSIRADGGWTFGSPSVLMMFHRTPGRLNKELAEMDECMPYYYKITRGHGQGAEKIMRAEASFMQERFTDAHIELESAYAQAEAHRQENMILCCDFLALRLSLHADVKQRYSFAERYASLRRWHNSEWINIWNAAGAYYHALRGETEQIPELFEQHRLFTVNMLAPCRPMMEMVNNQVYLSQGDYAKVIGRSAELLKLCAGMHYALVGLHIRIQTAAAYERLGKSKEACAWLARALADAVLDGFVLPFAENYNYIKSVLMKQPADEFIAQIIKSGEAMQLRIKSIRPAALAALTEQEHIIVELIAQRLSNREIGQRLFLSEGSVKQYVNRIYAKLHIEGSTRIKRKLLADLLAAKN